MNKELEEAIKRIKILLNDECNCEECIKDKKAYKVVLNYIENSISEEVIEKKIEKLEQEREKATKENQMGTGILLTGGINYLQELLEGK